MAKFNVVISLMLIIFLAFLQDCIVHCILNEKYIEDLIKIYTNAKFDNSPTVSVIKPEKVSFFLFTNEKPGQYTQLDRNEPYINNPQAEVVFLIHGWSENRERQWYEDLKNAFLIRNQNYYVIQVDWREPADHKYVIAAYNTKPVGRLVTEFIINLIKTSNIALENILLVGHSLGGQVCGFAGKTMLEQTGQKLPRIIALDPAGPLFFGQPAKNRLNKNDAEVVEVIHTNGGTFGYFSSCGTIDFFPNGGTAQPGCDVASFKELRNSTILACSHRRSWQYFTKAVLNPYAFWAKKCDSFAKFFFRLCEDEKVSLGDLHTQKTGNYYFVTSNIKPFNQIEPRMNE